MGLTLFFPRKEPLCWPNFYLLFMGKIEKYSPPKNGKLKSISTLLMGMIISSQFEDLFKFLTIIGHKENQNHTKILLQSF
jgi:hypothetical protein